MVVVAIIGLLVGLLLPAVQAARRAQCKNNLRQIGLAMLNYEGALGAFPPGFVSRSAATNGPGLGPGWGWGAMVLPYLEQTSVRVDFTRDIADPANAQARLMQLPIFSCPSDPSGEPTFMVANESGVEQTQLAFANYVAVGGTFEVTAFPDTGTGVMFRNRSIKIAEIIDGTSQTLLVGERASRQSPQTTWVGAVTNASVPPNNPSFENEGPPVLPTH